MNSRKIRFALPLALLLSLAIASLAVGATQDHGKGPGWDWGKKKGHFIKWKDNRNTFRAFLTGRNEIPATHSRGTGRLTLTINADNTMSFELTYSGLANPATAAHVHFGQPFANGGVSFFFCGGGGKPACPPGNTTTPVTITGTVAAADVLAIPSQLLPAGDLVAIGEEIRAGFTYANIHTAVSPGGEIRGQLSGKRGFFFRGFFDDDDD
jgi:hypothetical protein